MKRVIRRRDSSHRPEDPSSCSDRKPEETASPLSDQKPEETASGLYHNDYSPRYHAPYNIYDKAREHMRRQKKH